MKRRSAVTAMVVFFICVAVYLNWNYTTTTADGVNTGKTLGQAELANTEEQAKEKPQDEYFASARLEKQKARDSAISLLEENSKKENITEKEREAFSKSIEQLATGAVAETRIETLVKAKGFEECVALVNDESVNVIVKVPEKGLNASDMVKIKDIVINETKIDPAQIKIVEIK